MSSADATLQKALALSSRDFLAMCDRVVAGQQIPSVVDLIRGCPFYKDDIQADAAAWARQTLEAIGAPADGETSLLALAKLADTPVLGDFLIAARACEAMINGPNPPIASAEAMAARCRFYCAVSGDRRSANHVAAFAVTLVYARALSEAAARGHAVGAVAWLLGSTGQRAIPAPWTRQTASAFVSGIEQEPGPGSGMVNRMMQCRTKMALGVQRARNVSSRLPPIGGREEPRQPSAWTADSDALGHPGLLEDQPELTRIVIHEVGNANGEAGKRIACEFHGLIGEPLPLAPVPDLTLARRQLVGMFPHAEAAVDAILAPLFGRPVVKLVPTLLVGDQGGGKTSFALAVARILGIPVEVYPCGGVTDSSLAGNARMWSTAACSLPVSLIRAHHHAGPAIVLDELDKAGTGRTNGAVWDALHALLEPLTAQRFRDPLIEAQVDLGHVVWIGTANTTSTMPRSLVDRVRVLAFPLPERQHLERLANNMIVNFVREQSLDVRWGCPLDGVELAALSAWWTGGSIRSLAKMVAAVLRARDLGHVRH